MQKKIQDSEEYLIRQRERSPLMKSMRKAWKNLKRSLLFWRQPSAADLFVNSSEDVYLKFVKAEYWQNNEVTWIYFMFLNLPIIVTCYFGGF
jgi:hypothetical protein